MNTLITRLEHTHTLTEAELIALLEGYTPKDLLRLRKSAAALCQKHYGDAVYTRGLIEFTNYCQNNCLYCGIRRSNPKVKRYRLTHEEILNCCHQGYTLGFRTFVLQGGEDPFWTVSRLVSVISDIRKNYSDCAITLSVGEHSEAAYRQFFEAGADRYLLRHETASAEHYHHLHPAFMSPENRMDCLHRLKAIGFQTGTGFMVGSPGQTSVHLAKDLLFIKELQPEMIGIGPFIPQKDTPFRDESAGTLEMTLLCIALLRLMNPKALIPATTALGTIAPDGREQGILSGANVVMPNLSPVSVRSQYALYDNKICTGDEAAECRHCLEGRMAGIGKKLVVSRGDCIDFKLKNNF